MPSEQQHRPGSVKNKVVNSDLQEERDKCAFDQKEMQALLHGGQQILDAKISESEMFAKHPALGNHHHFYEMDRNE